MQRIKWALMITAILLGIGGAILTRPRASEAQNTEPFYAAESCISANADLPATAPVH
jgi:hypothetical protein